MLRSMTDIRTSILKRAEQCLQRGGYTSFSFRSIAAELGIKSASVHYHFPSKEDLAVALLGRYRARFEAWAQTRAGAPPAENLREWLEYWSGLCRQGAICPGGAFSAEISGLPDRVHDAVEALLGAERRWLVEMLCAARAQATVRSIGTPEEQADLMLASLQGGVQLARITRSRATFTRVVEQLRGSIFAASESP